MSDYIPNPPNPGRDPRDYDRLYDAPSSGRGVALIVGILVAIALVAGLMLYSNSTRHRTDLAQQPAPDRTLSLPADQPRTPAIPPAVPAPAPANPTAPRQ